MGFGRHFNFQEIHPDGKKHREQKVYFIQMNGLHGDIKIGISYSPHERLKNIQCSHPEPVFMLGLEGGGRTREKFLHEKFSHLRKNGEWFSSGPDLLEYIAALPPMKE